jgi:pimeloyl-ACP methyl ester carboxylesterase
MNRSGRESLPIAYSDPRGAGIPIVLVHGFGHNRVVWEKLVDELSEDFRPISVDLRGHAESPWSPTAAYHPSDYAADLPALLDRLKIDRSIVIGHSLGGNVATLFAATNPERLRALVLVDTGPALEASGTEYVTEEVGQALRSYASIREFRHQLGLTHPAGDPEMLDRLAETSVVKRVDGRYEPALDPGVLAGSDAEFDLVALERVLWVALGELRCPVLVVRGGVSAILSEKVAREMVDEVLVDGRLVTLPAAGHAVMIDDGPGLASCVRDFLADPAVA